jgi:hypothetical protein
MVRKKAIHESIKMNYSPSKGSKIAFETQRIHASNDDGNMVVEIGRIQRKTRQIQNQQRPFYESIEKKDGKYICIRDMGVQTCHWKKIKINKERLQTSVFLLFLRLPSNL